MDEIMKIDICDINLHVVCSLCAGYFIDATTVTECLHTFCKSCIVKYLQTNRTCPLCNAKVHETQPTLSLRLDRVMQEVVYKLIPRLFDEEEKRRQDFYRSRGLMEEIRTNKNTPIRHLTTVYTHPEAHSYANDELVELFVRRENDSTTVIPSTGYVLPDLKKYIRCSSRYWVRHLRLILEKKLGVPQQYMLEIVCCGNVLPSMMTLKHAKLLFWHEQQTPLPMMYRLQLLAAQ